jgi:predicted house-cleaning NTP pyrophosphatase (Maf/HAM1 superfamily)
MSTQGSASNLSQAARVLFLEWEKAKVHWRDVKSQEFEYTFLKELPSQVAGATTAMEEIDQLLKKVRGDCE